MKIGIVQPDNLIGYENVEHNRKINSEMICSLFDKGATIVVLPECADTQYQMTSKEEVRKFSETLTGPSVSHWIELAMSYRKYIAGGIIERDGDNFYNTAVLVGPDGMIGHYRKMHLFDWEREFLTEGDLGFPNFKIEELDITIGMLICYDLRFPEAVRTHMLNGCDLILVPTTWTSIGKSMLWDEKGYCHANYLAIAHSHSNRIAFACANRAGQEGDVTYLGASIILDSKAKVVAGPAKKEQANTLIGKIDPTESRNKQVGAISNLQFDRRPEYYNTLTSTLKSGVRK
ncbi:MAG TPA: nitrilase-related carbon-nitrogen hydrolase [Pseudogracilibacillus sp.]|nr:nitrilase-related carbon-nitrogen hydrolase [Pseudogracilibacillus sp.]